MKVGNNASITEFCRKQPITQESVDQLKDAAAQTFSTAIDMFFKPDREVSDAKLAYNDLSDLQGGLKALHQRQQLERNANIEAAQTKCDKAEYRQTLYNCRVEAPEANNAGLQKMIVDMNSLLGLYACVAMVPGAMSVTVKNTAKEMLEFSHRAAASSQYSSSSAAEEGSRARAEALALTLVGAGAYASEQRSYAQSSSHSQGGSSSQESTNFSNTRTTTDERLMPLIHDLSSRVSEMTFLPANKLAMVSQESNSSISYRKGQTKCDGDRLWVPEDGVQVYEPKSFFWDKNDSYYGR